MELESRSPSGHLLEKGEIEVLKGVAIGLRLRELHGHWQFVDSFDGSSRVPESIMRELFVRELLAPASDGLVEITDAGRAAVSAHCEALVGDFKRWLKGSQKKDSLKS